MDRLTARQRQNAAELRVFGVRVVYTSTRDGADHQVTGVFQEATLMQDAQGMVEYRDQFTIDQDAIPEPRQGDRVAVTDLGRTYVVDTFQPTDLGTRWRLAFRAALTS